MKKQLLVATLASILLLSSCGSKKATHSTSGSKDITTTNQTVGNTNNTNNTNIPEVKEIVTNLYADEKLLAKAEEDLKNLPQFKGKDLKFFQEIKFFKDGRIKIDIQDPVKPENIDNYQWKNGTWSAPEPVQISWDGDLSANLVSLSEAPFTTVSKVYKNWLEKAKEVEWSSEDNLSIIFFHLWVPDQSKSWRASQIQWTRAKYDIKFDLNWNVLEFKKS